MTNSVFIDANLTTCVLRNVAQIPEGYTKVSVEQLSNRIISLKYDCFFYTRQFSSFMVSNELLNRMQEPANVICMTLLRYRNNIFRLKFRGTVEDLLQELNLAPNGNITLLNDNKITQKPLHLELRKLFSCNF
jgi:hypothetical protein